MIASALLVLLVFGASACMPSNPQSIVEFDGIRLDFIKLSRACSPETCTIYPNRIIVRSSAENVYLTVGNHSIRFRERNRTVAWSDIIYEDLTELKKLGVVLEDGESIKYLSRQAEPARAVSRCAGEWRTFTLDCGCEYDTGIEWCMDCLESPSEERIPPKKLFFAEKPLETKPVSFLERLVNLLRRFLNKITFLSFGS